MDLSSNFVKLALRIIVGLVLFIGLMLNSNIERLKESWSLLSVSTLIFCFAAYVIGLLLNAVRWHVLLPTRGWKRLFILGLIAQTYSMILFGQLAGEAVKAYRLGKGHQDAEKVAASIIADKMIGLIAVLFIGLYGMFFTELTSILPLKLGLWLISLALVFMVGVSRTEIARSLVNNNLCKFGSRYTKYQNLCNRIGFFFDAGFDYFQDIRILTKVIVYGILAQLVYIAVMFVIAGSLRIQIPFLDWFWIHAVVSLATLLPLSVAGIGVREGAFVGVLSFLNVPMETALVLSLSIFGLQLGQALLGLVAEIKDELLFPGER